MRALRFNEDGAIALDLFAPLPEYQNAEEYLIEICAVAITAEELDWRRRGLITALGHAFSGRIEASPPTSHFLPGTKVFGMLPLGGTSAAAEYIHATEEQFATIPDHLAFEGAAAFPLAASVAWHSFLFARFEPTMEVTIVGTNNLVGDMAVWLAQMRCYRGWAIGPWEKALEITPSERGAQNRLVSPIEIGTHGVLIDLSLHKPEEVVLFNIEHCRTLLTLASTKKRPTEPSTNIKVIDFPADHQRNNVRDILEAFVPMEIPEHFELRSIALGFDPFFDFSSRVDFATQNGPLLIRMHYREYGSSPPSESNVPSLSADDTTSGSTSDDRRPENETNMEELT